tara:strand:- start:645 stop:902 length:258 start_codon:yes stop_codon:yes gene_type:complete
MDRSSQSSHAPLSRIQRDTRDPNAHPVLYPAFMVHRNSAIIFVGLDWDENLKLKTLLSERGYRVTMRLRQIPNDTIVRSTGDYLN